MDKTAASRPHQPAGSPSRAEHGLDLPEGLRDRLEGFRRHLWKVKVLEGLLAAVFGLALSYLVVFGLDRVIETPGWLRVAILVVGASGFGLFFPLKCHRWVWKQRGLEQAGRLLRHRYPRLGDQLLGIVELAKQSAKGELQGSETLVRAAMAQVDEKVRDRDLRDGVPDPRHRRWGWAAAAVAIVALLAMIVVPAAGRNALARWLMPWNDTPRYTFAQLEELENRRVVPQAEPFELEMELRDSTRWKPERARVKVAGQARLDAGRDADDAYRVTVPPQTADGDLSVRVGDALHRMEVAPKPRPELQSMSATLQLPDYLRYEHDPVVEVRGGSVSVVEGAQVSFSGEVQRELAAASFDGEPIEVSGTGFSAPSFRVGKAADREIEIDWRDSDGLEPKDPLKLRVDAVEDARPEIVARKLTREQVVLESEVIHFDLKAGDDFGVRQIGLEWQGLDDDIGSEEGASGTRGEKVVVAGAPEKTTLAGAGTFSAEREGVGPQVLSIRAFAEDYLPNGERAYSPAFVVRILSPDDHALWLTEQFGRWFRQSQEVYEREQLLHDTNRELRELSAEELDRPETRRRIEEQASAETANGQRLGRLTEAGKELVRQAARNEEFDPDALERWARALEGLEEIADERMPSVADLLADAAQAAGHDPSQTPPSPSSSDQPPKPGQEPPKPGTGGSGKAEPGNDSEAKPAGGAAPNLPEVPNVSENRNPAGGGAGDPVDPDADKPTPVPSVSDIESGHMEIPEKDPGDSAEPKPPASGRLTLPQTQLAGGVTEEEGDGGGGPSPAQRGLDEALEEQAQLLADFRAIADELQELLSSLEASTFVKRLKAASRKQIEVAGDLNSSSLDVFGLDRDEVKRARQEAAEAVAEREIEQSETVRLIQSDLEAYFQRKQDARFENILVQMKDTEVVSELRAIGQSVTINLNGRSIVAAEFWADHLDRWAEELVAAAKSKPSEGEGGEQPSLPPHIVLKVMQILHGEMALREETRELENAKGQLESSLYGERAYSLSVTQRELGVDTDEVIGDIYDLPNGAQDFEQETQLLHMVRAVMAEAEQILATPDTGPRAIAAETEVIELLLQSKRFNPNGGGGGGGSSPGGGGGGTTSDSALARLGRGDGLSDEVEDRNVEQATGSAGRDFPDEFRSGLDAYFNRLEKP